LADASLPIPSAFFPKAAIWFAASLMYFARAVGFICLVLAVLQETVHYVIIGLEIFLLEPVVCAGLLDELLDESIGLLRPAAKSPSLSSNCTSSNRASMLRGAPPLRSLPSTFVVQDGLGLLQVARQPQLPHEQQPDGLMKLVAFMSSDFGSGTLSSRSAAFVCSPRWSSSGRASRTNSGLGLPSCFGEVVEDGREAGPHLR